MKQFRSMMKKMKSRLSSKMKRMKKLFGLKGSGNSDSGIEIPRPYAYQDITAPLYIRTERLISVDENFEAIVMEIIESIGDMDVYNAPFADSLIDEWINEGLCYLDQQRYEHHYIINKSIRNLFKGDLQDHEDRLEDVKATKKQYEEELETLVRIQSIGTVFELSN